MQPPGQPHRHPTPTPASPPGLQGRSRGQTTDAAAAAEAAAFAEHARRVLDRHLPATDYRPLTTGLRLGLALAGVGAACALFWVLAERPGKKGLDPRLLQADSARCAPGQTLNCVGGQAQVILVPTPPAVQEPASAPGP